MPPFFQTEFKLTLLAATLAFLPLTGHTAGAGGGLFGGSSYSGSAPFGNGGSRYMNGETGTLYGVAGNPGAAPQNSSSSGTDGTDSGLPGLTYVSAASMLIGGGGGGGGAPNLDHYMLVSAFGGNGGKGATFSTNSCVVLPP